MNMKLFYHMLSTNGGVSQTKIDSFRIDLISFHLMLCCLFLLFLFAWCLGLVIGVRKPVPTS
jgi:hypothetical protein